MPGTLEVSDTAACSNASRAWCTRIMGRARGGIKEQMDEHAEGWVSSWIQQGGCVCSIHHLLFMYHCAPKRFQNILKKHPSSVTLKMVNFGILDEMCDLFPWGRMFRTKTPHHCPLTVVEL